MTSYAPAAAPQYKADPRWSYRVTLAGASSNAIVAATGTPDPLFAYAAMRRAAPLPVDHLAIAQDVMRLAALDKRAPKSADELVKEAESTRTAANAFMRKTNDLALARIAFRPESERTIVRSASINVGQLDIVGLIKVAHAAQRREFYNTVLAELLNGRCGVADERGGITCPSGAPDVIQCQEVWIPAARKALRNAAEHNGYICVFDDNQMKAYGLQLLIRKRPDFKRIVAQGIIEFVDDRGWSMRAAFDRIWGSKRGLAYAIVELANGEKLLTTTTHLSPLPQYEALRAQQLEAMAKLYNTLARNIAYSVHGSDMNTPDSTAKVSKEGLAGVASGVIAFHRFLKGTSLSDAWAAVDSTELRGTMNPHFSQFMKGDYNMRGKRIDYQLAGCHKPGKMMGAVAYRTLLGGLYPVGDGTRRAFSDHLMVETTYVLA